MTSDYYHDHPSLNTSSIFPISHHEGHFDHNASLNTSSLSASYSKPLPLVAGLWTFGVLSLGYALSRLFVYASSITEVKSTEVVQLEMNHRIVTFLRSPVDMVANLSLPASLAQLELSTAHASLLAKEIQLKNDPRFTPFFSNPPYAPQQQQQHHQHHQQHQQHHQQHQQHQQQQQQLQQQTQHITHRANISAALSATSTSSSSIFPATPLVFPTDSNFGSISILSAPLPTEPTPIDPNLTPFEIFHEYLQQKQCVELGLLNISQVSHIILQVCEYYARFQKISSLPPIPISHESINIYEPTLKYFQQFQFDTGYVSSSIILDLAELCILEITLGDSSATIF